MAKSRICSVNGCGKPHKARGYCRVHYYQWRQHGDPLIQKRVRNGSPLRFIHDIALSWSGDDCLLWPYTVAGGGYGALRIYGNKKIGSHALVCKLVHGPKPADDYEVAHSCGVRLCCNPAHLRWATRAENHADKIVHGTSVRGERNGVAQLTEDQVREIKSLQWSVSQNKLAKEFGVCTSTIRNIRTGKTWGWLD